MKHTETTETEKELTTTSSSTQPTKSPRHRGFRKFGVAIAAVLSLVGLSAAVVGIVTSSASAESDQNEQKPLNLTELAEDNAARGDVGAKGEIVKGIELGEGIQPGLEAEDIEALEPGDIANIQPGVEPGESALL